MVYSLSNQMYKYEHGPTVAEQRADDLRMGEAAGALRDLRRHLGRIFRPGRRVRSGRGAGDVMAASVRVMSSVR
ncbi:MAG TPA: hypothetical protein VK817_06070 [Trebonia sp.]|jgi:hypothetical protein|nr:hypothetical protein [Trebonia sp.]